MGIGDFVLMCKDFLYMILYTISSAISTLFSMPVFLNISVGQIALGVIVVIMIINIILESVGNNLWVDF